VRAWRLTQQLALDPSSHVYAALAGWAYPMSREALTTADLFDLFAMANAAPNRKPTPYPRPWTAEVQARKQLPTMSVAQYRALRARLEKEDAGG
jgi:hypothetical protein